MHRGLSILSVVLVALVVAVVISCLSSLEVFVRDDSRWWTVDSMEPLSADHEAGSESARGEPSVEMPLLSERPTITSIMLIPSKATSVRRRQLFRDRWRFDLNRCNVSTEQFPLVFLFGSQDLSPSEKQLVDTERERFGDTMLLPQCTDANDHEHDSDPRASSSTTCKVRWGIAWAHSAFIFPYLLRMGDDAYFNVQEYMRLLQNGLLPQRPTYMGYMLEGRPTTPAQRSIFGPIFPRYAAGMGFLITADVAEYVYSTKIPLTEVYPEDAAVGSWFTGLQVQFVHDERFHDVWGGSRHPESLPCQPTDLVIHYMREPHWKRIDADGVMDCTMSAFDTLVYHLSFGHVARGVLVFTWSLLVYFYFAWDPTVSPIVIAVTALYSALQCYVWYHEAHS